MRLRVRSQAPEKDDFVGLFADAPDDLDPPPLPPPAELEEAAGPGLLPLRTRTLRSKKGREVFMAVQLLINRLEAYGFPVQRYDAYADGAQELKLRMLASWLHATWMPGGYSGWK